jgi:porphobilinogen deaminase
MKKKDTKAPPKRKKERNVMVCPAVPSEKKKRETVQIGYSSYKRKKELRERRNVCWPHGRVENPVDRNIIEIREKKKKLR